MCSAKGRIYASSALGFGVTNTTSIPVIAGLSCDPECSIDASLECRYEHKQRNNDSKDRLRLESKLPASAVARGGLTGSFCHSTAGRGWTVLLTHQGPFLSQRGQFTYRASIRDMAASELPIISPV